MRFFFTIAFYLLITSASAQIFLPTEIITEEKIEYPPLLVDPAEMEGLHYCIFPEEPTVDLEEWNKYLIDNLVLDEASIDSIPAGRYTVVVQFVVRENGKLMNVSILKEPGYGLGERGKKLISNCIGIWKPVVEENGKIVPGYRKQPITFVIEEDCEELEAGVTL